MLKSKMVFDDGSEIMWENREALLYKENEKMVYVWVDFDSLFFGSRIVKLESIQIWHGTNDPISEEKKSDIVAKVRKYYGNKSIKVE